MRRWLLVALLFCATPAYAQLNPSANGVLIGPARTLVTLTADAVTPAASDTLVTMAKLVGDTATAGVTTYAVSASKTFRVQSISLSFTSSTTTANKVRVRFRTLSSGACIATSPLVGTWELALPNGTLAANAGQASQVVTFVDGIEFTGATRNVCFSAIGAVANGTLTITAVGYEY